MAFMADLNVSSSSPTVSSTGPVTFGEVSFYNAGISGGTASNTPANSAALTGTGVATSGAAASAAAFPWKLLLLPLALAAGIWWLWKNKKKS